MSQRTADLCSRVKASSRAADIAWEEIRKKVDGLNLDIGDLVRKKELETESVDEDDIVRNKS